MPTAVDQLNILSNKIASLFDDGLSIYTNFAGRVAASKLTLAETNNKIDQILAKPTAIDETKIFGVDRNIMILGTVSILVIGLIVYRNK